MLWFLIDLVELILFVGFSYSREWEQHGHHLQAIFEKKNCGHRM